MPSHLVFALHFEGAGLSSQQILIVMHLCSSLFLFLESYSLCNLVLHYVKSPFRGQMYHNKFGITAASNKMPHECAGAAPVGCGGSLPCAGVSLCRVLVLSGVEEARVTKGIFFSHCQGE